jgi:hypothetical protein
MGIFDFLSNGPKCDNCGKRLKKMDFANATLYVGSECKSCGKTICYGCEKEKDKPKACIWCGGPIGMILQNR